MFLFLFVFKRLRDFSRREVASKKREHSTAHTSIHHYAHAKRLHRHHSRSQHAFEKIARCNLFLEKRNGMKIHLFFSIYIAANIYY